MNRLYKPERGDIIWLDFNPQSGHEQVGRSPALVLSPKPYNEKIGLILVCPITSKIKNFSFEVKIPENLHVEGVILSDQVKSFDWKSRKAEYICKMPNIIFDTVIEKLNTLIQ